jgi:bifunctional DNase/RNase
MPNPRIVTFCVGVATLLLTSCAPEDSADALSSAERTLIEVSVDSIRSQALGSIVFLKEIGGEGRVLPITIGAAQARSIALALREISIPRPNTHDLVKNLLEELDGEVERVVITELRKGIYFARIDFRVDGRRVSVDARPSDAIAVALRIRAPLFANRALFVSDSERIEADHPLPDCPADPAPQSEDRTVV